MLITEKNFSTKSSQETSLTKSINQQLTKITVADSIIQILTNLGVRHAFGVGGGAIAPIWEALEESHIEVLYFRHEVGAAFAAMEAYFANGSPVAVFTTTGPGITNALTGMMAARCEGAKVIFISPSTPETHEGRWAFQETNSNKMPQDFFCHGSIFHYARHIKSSDELPEIAQQLTTRFSKPGGFVAHLSIPSDVQSSNGCHVYPDTSKFPLLIPEQKIINQVSELLSSNSFAIWVGFGARDAAQEILQLAERTGAAVMSSPRGKGIFPENHPQYLGVTGFAGHDSVLQFMKSTPPEYILVLGTRLGEFTSFWNPLLIPPKGFIHVDIDPQVPGAAYPNAQTFPVIADVKTFVSMLMEKLPIPTSKSLSRLPHKLQNSTCQENNSQDYRGLVRPQVLMSVIQETIIDASNAIVIAEAGNSFAWTTHHLKFSEIIRWRVSTGFGAMGHATTGVVGAALTNTDKAVAVVGDGAMLMNHEINTAVQYNIPAVWIVLNDTNYGMCNQGAKMLGYREIKAQMAPTNFVMLARSMGADGIRVDDESQLKAAISQAMKSQVPFVVDVIIDPSEIAPTGSRNISLIQQIANTKN